MARTLEKRTSYEPMFPTFNNAMEFIIHGLLPDGFILTTDESQCDTLEKITTYYNKYGKILVWNGASDRTIFGEPKYNHMFRAWHDYYHIKYQLPFTKYGELQVMRLQQYDCQRLWLQDYIGWDTYHVFCLILQCEIEEQLNHFIKTGEYVKDQRKFAKDFMGTCDLLLAYNLAKIC